MVDMHKEIKLSDIFGRKPKEPGEPKPEKAPKDPKPNKERRRKDKAPKQPKREKATPTFANEAPPLPEIPLMRAFNLLPKEEARQAKEGASPLPQVLVALAGVLVFAALAAFYLMAGTDVAKKKGEVEDLRAELAAYQAPKQQPSVEDKSSALVAERLQRTTALGSAITSRLAWDRVLRELALVIPDNVALTSIVATEPVPAAPGALPTNVTITGDTEEQDDVATLLARLSVVPELTAVSLVSAERTTNDEGALIIRFSIKAATRQGPA